MAISAAHLGQRVQCPHCNSVVQTPAPAPADPTLPLPTPQNVSPADEPTFLDPNLAPIPTDRPSSPSQDVTVAMDDAPLQAGDTNFAEFKPKPRKDSSVLLIIALIFLVPYAVTMTFFVFFMWARGSAQGDPLEYLRDPMPAQEKGGPRKVQRKQPDHTLPIAERRKTTLGKSVKAGDLLVTPERVVLTAEGDLKLMLRVRNESTSSAFEPMHDSYVNERKHPVKPYTFLESRSLTLDHIYGGYLAYYKNADATGEPESFPVLSPKEEVTIVLQTEDRYRAKYVSVIAGAKNDEFTWRVQVRRGFVRVDNKDVSATTVIGVDFSSKEIVREGKS